MATFVWPPISVTASSGPLQFNKNAVATTVSQDTVTPANSVPLPVSILGTNGVPVDPATNQANVIVNGTFTASDAVVGAPVGDGTLVTGASTSGSIVYANITDGFVAWTLLIKGYVSGTIYTEASNNTTNGTDGDWVEVKGRRTGTAPGTESVLYAMVSNGYYRGNAAGFKAIRTRLIGGVGPSVQIVLSKGMGATFLNSGIPGGSSNIGSVNVAASVLPTGAATAANQATEITSLATIATNSGTQATAALQTSGNASLTTIATNSGTQATAALQTSGNSSLTTIATNSGTQATAANQTAIQGTVAAGTAATKSSLGGGVFNTTLPTLTTGQQAAIQLDASGRQIMGTSAAVIGAVTQSGTWNVATVTAVTTITNPVTANQATAAAKTVKSAAITVGTTSVRATTDAAAPTAGRTVLKIKPSPNNTGAVYLGTSTVVASATANANGGMLILPAETMELSFDAGDYYLISDTAGQVVHIIEQE